MCSGVNVDVGVGVCDYAEDAGNPNGSIREVRVIRTQGQVLADVLMKVLVLIKTRSLQGCYGGRVDGVFWWWWVLGIGCMSLGVRGMRDPVWDSTLCMYGPVWLMVDAQISCKGSRNWLGRSIFLQMRNPPFCSFLCKI